MRKEHTHMLACIGQFLLCVVGGFWAGNAAEPGSGATSWTGAVGMVFGLFLAYAAARTVGMALGALLFGKQVLRWLRSRSRPVVDRQTAREERGLHWVMTAVAMAVLLLCSVVVAIMVFAVSQDGSLMGALSRFMLVAAAAALLTLSALHAVNEVHWGAPPV